MSSQARAQNGTQQTVLSNQGTGPTPSPEQTPNWPLTRSQKRELIQAAINKKCECNFEQWGNLDLARLINYGTDGESIGDYTELLTSILLYCCDPKHNEDFNKAIGDYGLDLIKKLANFFIGLSHNSHYSEYTDFWDLNDHSMKDSTMLIYAKQYLAGEDLTRVQAPDAEKLKTTPSRSSTPWLLTTEPEEEPFTLTDEELIVALDRYHPGIQWPADKKTVIANEKMRNHLIGEEKYRLRILNETPEQKEKRLVENAVYSEINGPTIPEQIRSVGETVAAAVKASKVLGPDTQIQFRLDKVKAQPLTMDPEETHTPASKKKPTRAVSGKGGAITPKKPLSSPAKKTAPAKKSTTKKKA